MVVRHIADRIGVPDANGPKPKRPGKGPVWVARGDPHGNRAIEDLLMTGAAISSHDVVALKNSHRHCIELARDGELRGPGHRRIEVDMDGQLIPALGQANAHTMDTGEAEER